MPLMRAVGLIFFEQAQYAGKHLHIIGPASLENLDQVNGENWNRRIHSIKVGGQAKVTVFSKSSI